MKKIFWIITAICTVLLTGCEKGAENVPDTALAGNTSETASVGAESPLNAENTEGLPRKVTAAAIKLEDGVLTVAIRNESRDDFRYNGDYSLEKKAGDDWQKMPILSEDMRPPKSEYTVGRFCNSEHTYDLNVFGELSEGRYRLVTDRFSAEFYIDGSEGTSYFYRDENGEWIADALKPANAPPVMGGISAIVAAQDEKSLTVRLTNWGYNVVDGWVHGADSSVFEYGVPFHVEVFLDKKWYVVPTKDIEFAFPLPLYSLSTGETRELNYDFFMYDPFPEGRYRVVNGGEFWVEFNAGTKIVPQNSLADGVVRSVTVSYFEDGREMRTYIDKSSMISELLSVISANPAERVWDWSGEKVESPIFGISATDANGWAFEGVWSNGYWINQYGEAYRLDLDTVLLKKMMVQYDTKTISEDVPIAWLSCGTYLCRDENGGWIAERLSLPMLLPQETPENVTAKIVENAGRSVTVQYTNKGEGEWMYGEGYSLEVLLDGEWYAVPEKPGNWGFTAVGIILPAGETRRETYNFYMYDDLSAGRYRVVTNGFALEFDFDPKDVLYHKDA